MGKSVGESVGESVGQLVVCEDGEVTEEALIASLKLREEDILSIQSKYTKYGSA